MPDYSNQRLRSLKIGISSYTEDEVVLDVVGNVNISGDGGSNSISLSSDGIATIGDVTIASSGIITSSNPGVTTVVYYGDGSNLFGVSAFSVIAQDLSSNAVYPTFANNTGVSSVGISSSQFVFIPSLGYVGIGTTNPSSKLDVIGDAKISGVTTSIGGFVGNLTGTASTATNLSDAANITAGTINTARLSGTYNIDISGSSNYSSSSGISTYSSTAGVATALQNSRTFEITGDIIASPVSFDGTGNVSFAATIQPNSVGLGTDTTGDYVQSVSGTVGQIAVTGGTGESSTPVISIANNATLPGNVTIANDLQVNHDLNVTGNITIGGTSAYIISNEFKVKDADIVVGFTTDSNGNDASTDTTANHGGIAVASTEGSPLVQLYNVAIGETNPATYKKIMWFKSGSFAGLNTDAWLINYAVGIGSTQFPSGTRLAAGAVQFTEHDLAVVRNINASGVVTASNFSGNASSATYASTAGISTYSNTAGIATYALISGISTVSQGLTGTPDISVANINASGISTLGTVQISSGIVTATSGVVTYYGDGRNLAITNPGIGIATESGTVGTGVTLIDFRGTGISTVTVSSGIATINITGGGTATPDISPVMMGMIF